jgi:hypothetical protein
MKVLRRLKALGLVSQAQQQGADMSHEGGDNDHARLRRTFARRRLL